MSRGSLETCRKLFPIRLSDFEALRDWTYIVANESVLICGPN
jgi:hypothetical protein